MRAFTSAVLAALTVVACFARPVLADGISVEKTITLDELVHTSDAIFTATVVESDAQWAEREAYGEKQRYVQRYRFRIQGLQWLKGKAKPPVPKALWLDYRGDPMPGKWVIVREHYASAFNPRAVKPGTKIVVFAYARNIESWGKHLEDNRAVLHARAIDTAACLPAMRAILARPKDRRAKPDASPNR